MKNYSIKLLQDGLLDLRRTRDLMIYHLSKKELKEFDSIERKIERDISIINRRTAPKNRAVNFQQTLLIKKLHNQGWTQRDIACLCNVSANIINSVVNNKNAYAS